jgi:replication-associated recombination protein RarA
MLQGDARRLINLIEMAINRSKIDGKKEITQDLVKKILSDKSKTI